MKFTVNDKLRGEKLVSMLSDKAQKYYYESDPLDVYQTIDGKIFVELCSNVYKCSSVGELNNDFEISQDEMEQEFAKYEES